MRKMVSASSKLREGFFRYLRNMAGGLREVTEIPFHGT